MALWRPVARGLRALFLRSRTDRDVADEVQHYLEQATAEHIARGLARPDAIRAARVELGGVTNVREQIRGSGWESAVDTAFGDLRYAARRLIAAPGFTLVASLTLAIGIGATTAIFSAVKPILIEPLPYPHPARLAMIWELFRDGRLSDGTFGMYRSLAERNRSFEAIAVFKPWQPTAIGSGQPERLEGQRVSASYLRVLGVMPRLGRDFQPADDRDGAPSTIILSDGLWRRRFGTDSAIIGKAISLDDTRHVVIGVMPPDFENVLAPSAELWAPLQYEMSQGRAWGHHLRTVGRLKPGISAERAEREVSVMGRAVLEEQRPETYDPQTSFIVTPLQDDLTRGVKPALYAIGGAVILLLVIACVNVANLVLARGHQRRAELALRTALGAVRGRLVRQLLTESLLLAVLGGVLGIAVAVLGVRAFVTLSPQGLPRLAAIGVDGSVLAVAFGITALVGLALGVIPALQLVRGDHHQALQHNRERVVGGHRRTRGALVVAEVALALVLLVGSGLLLRSLQRLFDVDTGFDSSESLIVQVQASSQRFADDSATHRFFSEALDAVRRVPGVASAALTSQLPLSGDLDLYGVHFDPRPSDDPGEARGSFRYAVSPGYIETMRIPLRRGRVLNEGDRAGAPPVALISESMAKRRLPGLDPIGLKLRIGDGALYTIVGVVGDVRQVSLALTESDAVYTTAEQWRFADEVRAFVIRTRGAPARVAPAVREAVWSVDKDQPIVRIATLDELVDASAAERRFALIVFEAFALAALVLAAAGIYGVLAGSVAERRREIGVRSALGATRSTILGMVVGQGMVLTALGIVIGLAGAAAATQGMVAMLFGVSRLDPLTYGGVIALLVAVSAVACAVPAWRASRVDPASTLRVE